MNIYIGLLCLLFVSAFFSWRHLRRSGRWKLSWGVLVIFASCMVALVDLALFKIGQHKTIEYEVQLKIPTHVFAQWKAAYEAQETKDQKRDLCDDISELFNSDQFSNRFSSYDQLALEDILSLNRNTLSYGNQWWFIGKSKRPFVMYYGHTFERNGEIDSYYFAINHPQNNIAHQLAHLARGLLTMLYSYDKERLGLYLTLEEEDITVIDWEVSAASVFGRFWFVK